MKQRSRKNEVIHRPAIFAETWMWLSDKLERQGQPFLLSFFLTVLLTPLSQLRTVQEFFTKYFVFDIPIWYVVATWLFIIFLSFTLYLQQRKRASLRGLIKTAHGFRKLEEDEHVIDAAESQAAFELIFADFILNRFGSNPEKRRELLQSKDFQKLRRSLRHYDEESQKKSISKISPNQLKGP